LCRSSSVVTVPQDIRQPAPVIELLIKTAIPTSRCAAQAFGISAFDENTGEPSNRGNWDLNLCCNSTRTYGIALPQAYLEAYVPMGRGLNIKVGHFYTPLGYETVPAPDNFFYTRGYILNSGEPFTHTGFLGSHTINRNWQIQGGGRPRAAQREVGMAVLISNSITGAGWRISCGTVTTDELRHNSVALMGGQLPMNPG
jgi:hypothetical protein